MKADRLTGWAGFTSAPIVARVANSIVVAGTSAVLAIAAWLEPSPLGHSTHLQLGLGRCTFFALTGYPCPMCGATTTFALMAHGRLFAGLLNQPFASLLFALSVAALAVAVSELVAPRQRWTRIAKAMEPYEGWLAAGFLGFMCAAWIYKIALVRSLFG